MKVRKNPDMALFKQRRQSGQFERLQRRSSLAEVVGADWPSLDFIEKPEFHLTEVMLIVDIFSSWWYLYIL